MRRSYWLASVALLPILALAGAASIAGPAAGQGADPIPFVTPSLVEESEAARAPVSEAENLQQATAYRRARGAIPVDQQVLELSAVAQQPRGDLESSSIAVLTLTEPPSLTELGKLIDQLDPNSTGEARATALLELPDGYPYIVSGPVETDFETAIHNVMTDTAEAAQRRMEAGVDRNELQDSEILQLSSFIAETEQARRELPGRVRVLGLSLPLPLFLEHEGAYRALGLAGVEVELGYGLTPFDATVLSTPSTDSSELGTR